MIFFVGGDCEINYRIERVCKRYETRYKGFGFVHLGRNNDKIDFILFAN